MDLIGATDWGDFKKLISIDAQDTFFTQPIIWRRYLTPTIDRFNENSEGSYQDINLLCLVNYNYMRSWPVTVMGEAGELEAQSIQVLFTKQYLSDQGYINGDNYFIYQPDYDRFILDGIIRKPRGDSSVSQAGDGSLLIEVIMSELKTKTGESRT